MAGCSRSPEAKSARYIDAGEKLLKKHDIPRAIIQFRNAIQALPGNATAYYQLGMAYLALENYPKAAAAFQETLSLNPRHAGAQLRLAQLLASSDNRASLLDAQKRLKDFLSKAPQNPDALHALALTELKLEQPSDAAQHLMAALALAPQDLVAAFTLAQAKLSQNDVKGAEQVLKKACVDSPKSTDALTILGRFYAFQNRFGEAAEQFRHALALDPKNGAALFNLAALENQMGNKQAAEQNFKLLASFPDEFLKPLYGLFLFQEGRRDEAIREFERLVHSDPEDRAARSRLAAAYQTANRTADAFKLLNAALKTNPHDLDALLERGELFLGIGKLDDAEFDLNAVLRSTPDSPEAHYAVAQLSLARGNALTYRQELNDVLRLNPSLVPVRVELAKSLIADKLGKAALAMLDGTPSSQKNAVPIIEQRNWAFITLEDMVQARAGIDQGLLLARTPDLLLQDALAKMSSGRYAEARVSIKEALGKAPADIRLLRVLAGTYAAEKQMPAAVAEVRAHSAANPKSAEIRFFLGNLLLETGNKAEAAQAFSEALALNPAATPAALELARLNLNSSNWTDARQQLTNILSTNENPQARLWLGMLEESVGNHSAAMSAFRKVTEMEPNNAIALNNLAYLLTDYAHQADEGMKVAQKALELAPGNPDIQDTLGWALYQKGLYQNAVSQLQAAIAKGGGPRPQYHLAMAYLRAGEASRGRVVLESALRKNPNLAEAKIAQDLFKSEGTNNKVSTR
jgi:tetratricopeptide (TPR) repeat protein